MRHIIRRTAGLFAGCLLFLSAEATAAEPVPARAGGAPGQNIPAYRNAVNVGDVGNAGRAKRTEDAGNAGGGTSRGAAPDTTGRAGGAEAGTVSRGAARRRASAYRTGYDTGYRNGYAAGYRAALDQTKKQAPAATPLLSSFSADTTGRRRRLVHSIGAEFRPEYIPPTNIFLAGANMAGARWPPTCVIRSASAPGRAPTVSTAAYTRELGSPITASATAGSWATRLPSTSSRARASHASARWYRSTTSGISACRSDGNPTTRTTTAPTS